MESRTGPVVAPPAGKGVRALGLDDQLPACPVSINRSVFDLAALARGRRVLDVGCGHGRNRAIVESAGGNWVGVEPFEGGAHTVIGKAEALPFAGASFDVVVMDAVLEHVQDIDAAFAETARVLAPGGRFVGYVAFMECFHEISYCHVSYMALQFYGRKHGLELTAIGGGGSFGIDYHLAVLFYPLPFGFLRRPIAMAIRGIFRLKSWAAYCGLRLARGHAHNQAARLARKYFQLECLRQSSGFTFMLRKPMGAENMA